MKPECVEMIMEKTAVGDWFLLYLLGQNIDHMVFKVLFTIDKNIINASTILASAVSNQRTVYGARGVIMLCPIFMLNFGINSHIRIEYSSHCLVFTIIKPSFQIYG